MDTSLSVHTADLQLLQGCEHPHSEKFLALAVIRMYLYRQLCQKLLHICAEEGDLRASTRGEAT